MVLYKCRCGSDDIHFKTKVKPEKENTVLKECISIYCKKCGRSTDPIFLETPHNTTVIERYPIHLLAKAEAAKAWNDMITRE